MYIYIYINLKILVSIQGLFISNKCTYICIYIRLHMVIYTVYTYRFLKQVSNNYHKCFLLENDQNQQIEY